MFVLMINLVKYNYITVWLIVKLLITIELIQKYFVIVMDLM